LIQKNMTVQYCTVLFYFILLHCLLPLVTMSELGTSTTLVWHNICFDIHVSWSEAMSLSSAVTVLSYSQSHCNLYFVQFPVSSIILLSTHSLPLLLLSYLLLAKMTVLYHCCKIIVMVATAQPLWYNIVSLLSTDCVLCTKCMKWTHGAIISACWNVISDTTKLILMKFGIWGLHWKLLVKFHFGFCWSSITST
jgi:hypothetical protein